MITETLTDREANIVEYVAVDNYSYAEISKLDFVSIQCIKGHIQHIYDKLGIKRNLQALTKWYYTGGREQIKATMLMLIFIWQINTNDIDGRMFRTRARRRGKDEIEVVEWEEFI